VPFSRTFTLAGLKSRWMIPAHGPLRLRDLSRNGSVSSIRIGPVRFDPRVGPSTSCSTSASGPPSSPSPFLPVDRADVRMIE
jgi:hypothetical protein